jgi:tetratricopeptide (TPR) repeat protein
VVAVLTEPEFDTDTTVFYALRTFRNAFLAYCRSRLQISLGTSLDNEVRTLFKKEWVDIERSALQAHETGIVNRLPIDSLDYLSVNHTPVLLEKYWANLAPGPDASGDASKRVRSQLTSWARELIGVRNPVAHAPHEPLELRDVLRYVDSAARILAVLKIPEAEQLRDLWSRLISDATSIDVVPVSITDTLPSREQITTDFVGRAEQLSDLWRWLGDDTRRIWALVGDGGKGKTTIAYEFASQARGILKDYNLNGVLWLSAKQRRFLEGDTVPTAAADFSDLETALDWVLQTLGWDEDLAAPTEDKLRKSIELLREFPMLVVADDIDSLDDNDEQAVEFFAQHLPQTASKTLLTSRRAIFGLGGCTTHVSGMTEEEVTEFLVRRAPGLGLEPARISQHLVRQVRDRTDGSPLYIEDLLRLASFYSLDHALDQWSGRRGDAAREYSLKREMEKLSKYAASVLGVLAYSEAPVSLQECATVLGLTDDQAESALGELKSWNLLAKPGLVEDIPRFTCSRNLGKLMHRTLAGTDEEQRIKNGIKGLRGVIVAPSRVRKYIQQAVALQRRKSQDEAENTLREGLRDVPNSGELHAMLGWLYSRWQPNARVADAQENFERAEALGSGGRDLYAHWADMELKRNEYRKAIAVCERAHKVAAKDDGFVWRLYGIAYTRLGKQLRQSLSTEQAADAFRRADRALRHAQELSRNDAGDLSRCFTARHALARACGDSDGAAKVVNEWQTSLPSDPYLQVNR